MQLASMVVLCAISGSAIAGNFATCVIDKMPGVQNDSAAYATMNLCKQENPKGMADVEQGSGRGYFSFKSGAECAAKKAASTPSQEAGRFIYVACARLYDKPAPWEEFIDPLAPHRK